MSATDKKTTRVPGDQRRGQLLEAAIRVFATKGFSGTKTRDVAAEAGVNEAILFRHFPTKDDLYAAILESVSDDEWADSARAAVNDDPLIFLREFVKQTLAWHRRRPELLRLVLYSALEQHQLAEVFRDRQVRPVIELLTEYIAAGQQSGRFATDIAADHAARVLFGTVAHQGLVLILLRGADTGMSDEQGAEAIARIALKGLDKKA